MSQTVTAVQAPAAIGRLDGHTNYASRDFVVANGVTVNAGDFVYFTAGTVSNATLTGDARPIGMAQGTATGNAAATVTVTVCVDPMMQYLLKASTSTFAVGDVGQYYDMANATQILVSSKSTTTGMFILLATGAQVPAISGKQGVNTSSYGIFKLVESALSPLGS